MTPPTQSPEPIPVAVLGASGRMGTLVCRAIENSADLTLTAAPDRHDGLESATSAHVVVDFTHPDAVMSNVRWALDNSKHLVIGTTGFDEARLETLTQLADTLSPTSGVLVIPNFSKGAMLAKHFAEVAAPFFDFVEILDYAHEHKAEAPSGTSADTARAIGRARAKAGLETAVHDRQLESPGARGTDIDGTRVHSIRMSGYVSHQEVLLGRPGELLSIRFDTLDREAFIPDVLGAIRKVRNQPGVHVGLAALYESL